MNEHLRLKRNAYSYWQPNRFCGYHWNSRRLPANSPRLTRGIRTQRNTVHRTKRDVPMHRRRRIRERDRKRPHGRCLGVIMSYSGNIPALNHLSGPPGVRACSRNCCDMLENATPQRFTWSIHEALKHSWSTEAYTIHVKCWSKHEALKHMKHRST